MKFNQKLKKQLSAEAEKLLRLMNVNQNSLRK